MGGKEEDLLTPSSESPEAGREWVIFNFGERSGSLTSDPELRFGQGAFEAQLSGAADGNGLGDALESEVGLVP